MQKLLIFTDLHFRTPGETILGVDPESRFKEGLSHALRRYPDTAHLILMGDLTNSGKVIEYEALKAALSEVPVPYTLMCGNHDNRLNLLETFPEIEAIATGHLQRALDIGDIRLITLDTLDGPPFRNDYHEGHLCADRLSWLETALASAPGKVIICMHHPAWSTGLSGMDEIKLRNADAFFEVLDRFNNVAHILTGHLHRTISGKARGYSFSTFKSPNIQTPLFLENLHISQSTPEPGAYGLVLLGDDIIVHTEDFQLALDDVEHCREALPD
ncbi:MAG: phosphodiesterase [Rhodobacteraceae bacterium]|nr:phosphodiesterase [Paracoccaceae bacterium]